MMELALTASAQQSIRGAMVTVDTESCAILLASKTERSDGTERLLVREIEFPAESDYTRRGPLEAELAPAVVARITKRARRDGLSIVFAHSHPGDSAPVFSWADDRGEEHLSAFLQRRHPDASHAAMVVSAGGVRARRLGSHEQARVLAIGPTRQVLADPADEADPRPWTGGTFDRQIRAFGASGQAAIERLRVAIVGLGGTGSLVAQELAHLGIRDFVLIDPDVVDATNLNRVANAGPSDVGTPKIDVAARYIQFVAPSSKVTSMPGDVIRARFAKDLVNADFIFGCTDSQGSRAVIQQMAYQYLIPCIDMGSTIAVNDGRITHVYGRVQLLAPGLACFTCSGLLDGNEVRRDMMTAFERQADPYIRGAREPAPSVMSLNGTVASLAMTMFLAVVAGVPSRARYVLYNALTSTMRSVEAKPDPQCFICSHAGALARGDGWPVLARTD